VKYLDTEMLVIGGGATGLGIAWDAALRGFRVVLVEECDLAHGTTGRFHGLLHSGGRYVVKDPESAVECIAENRILRRTHAHCIEDTGGLFVVTPEDEGDYPDQFVAACARAGVPCQEISPAEALRREPLLNPRISRAFEVPDGSADAFLAAHATAQAAQEAGARILTYHKVVALESEGSEGDRRIVGARVCNRAHGEEFVIRAAMTVNAAGAWAGRVAGLAGLAVDVIPGKGALLAMNHRIVNTVVNRCRMPTDGDIIVPAHTVAVLGTTDRRVDDPENLTVEPWEVELLLREGDALIPGLSRARVVRAWAGVRPLYQESHAGGSRDATRAFTLLDHRERDGVSGLLSILGGKWTTFRLMAEKAVDKACEQLGSRKPCTTASTPVPGVEQGHYWLGHRLHEVEEQRLQGELVCECELVTRAMLETAVRANPMLTLDDLRRDVRLGMGPCQGGFCTYRAIGILHEMMTQGEEAKRDARPSWDVTSAQSPAASGPWPGAPRGLGRPASPFCTPNLLLRDFLQERWKGVAPVLWGAQLQQARLDEMLYLGLMNADHLPDDELSSPMSGFYAGQGESDSGGGQCTT
jgi:glycerol-3-phosphate dehydrogenase